MVLNLLESLNYGYLKKFSYIAFIGSLFLGVGLYHMKQRVSLLEQDLKTIHKKIILNKENLHILKAEWSFLNNPKRLQNLNDRFLHLKNAGTYQVASIDKLKFKDIPAPLTQFAKLEGQTQPLKSSSGKILLAKNKKDLRYT